MLNARSQVTAFLSVANRGLKVVGSTVLLFFGQDEGRLDIGGGAVFFTAGQTVDDCGNKIAEVALCVLLPEAGSGFFELGFIDADGPVEDTVGVLGNTEEGSAGFAFSFLHIVYG